MPMVCFSIVALAAAAMTVSCAAPDLQVQDYHRRVVTVENFTSVPIIVSDPTVVDDLTPAMVAAASDGVIEAECRSGCLMPSPPSHATYHVVVKKVLYERSGLHIGDKISIRGNRFLDIPLGNSLISIVSDKRDSKFGSYFLTSRVTSIGIRKNGRVIYRSVSGGRSTYQLGTSTWIGCLLQNPNSTRCAQNLLRTLNVVTSLQRSAYTQLQAENYAIGLFWGAVLLRDPTAQFPSKPCKAPESLSTCTSVQLDALKSQIHFQPSV
jgi:hypothetical protein